mmetsp:Transcript_12602/g.26590  ORF Transcript_12602/g.26590 Transcript_12602/m.26590 type:complete len:187 (+) Transcript_12602:47-607(+)
MLAMLSGLQRGGQGLRRSTPRPLLEAVMRHRRANFHGEVSDECSSSSVTQDSQGGLRVGEVYKMERDFTAEEVRAYAKLGGDTNSIHICPEAAAAANFPGCVVHGMLYAGLFPAIIGTRQPGAMYLKQTLRFRTPVIVGETVQATVKVEKISGRRAVLSTSCHKVGTHSESPVLVLDGDALALLPA